MQQRWNLNGTSNSISLSAASTDLPHAYSSHSLRHLLLKPLHSSIHGSIPFTRIECNREWLALTPSTMMRTQMRSYNVDLLRRNPCFTVPCFKTRSDHPPFAITFFFAAMHCNSFLQRYAIPQFIFFSSSRFWHRVRLLYILFRSLKWKRNNAIVANPMNPHKAFYRDHPAIRTLPPLEKHESHANRIPNQIVRNRRRTLPRRDKLGIVAWQAELHSTLLQSTPHGISLLARFDVHVH